MSLQLRKRTTGLIHVVSRLCRDMQTPEINFVSFFFFDAHLSVIAVQSWLEEHFEMKPSDKTQWRAQFVPWQISSSFPIVFVFFSTIARARSSLFQAERAQMWPPYACSGVYTVERQAIWGVQRSTNLNNNVAIISPL